MSGLVSLCLAGLVIAFAAPVAEAEIQRPHEVITVLVPTRNGFSVYAVLHPQKRVAILGAQTAVERPGAAWGSSTSYVKRVPRGSFGEVAQIDFGAQGRIEGRFLPEGKPHVGHHSRFCRGRPPESESGGFEGKIVFRGDGGYLNVSTDRAPTAFVRRTFRLECKKGHAADFENDRPGLFGYVQSPTDYFSDSNATYLRSVLRKEGLVTEFVAARRFRENTVDFKAVGREWLPGNVATTRTIELESVLKQTFELLGPEEHPESARVHPPTPFSGAAEWTSGLDPLSGDLTAAFLGKELPLAGPGSEAEVCPRPDQDELWDCP